MPENKPNIEHNPSERTPEDEAALKAAREQLQTDANEVLVAKEAQPQVPKASFQAYPDSSHAEQTEQIIGQPKVDTDVHEEIPGMKLPDVITTEEGKRQAMDELLKSNIDPTKPGVADELQKKMENLIS